MRSCPLSSCHASPGGQSLAMISRREWIKRFAVGSTVTLVGGVFQGRLLAEIEPGADPANILKFDIATLPALQSVYGSMRFSLFGTNVANGVITITRAPGDVFHAVSAYCTHAGCIVDPYDNSPGTEAMVCSCHGSVYDIQGQLLEGVIENQENLPAYHSSLNGNVLSVEIPNLNFKVNSIALYSVNGNTRRFLLTFPTKQGARYRVIYTPDLVTPPAVQPFYTSPNGITPVTMVTQTAPSPNPRTVYVDSTTDKGFYMVEMVVDEYVA